MLLNLGPGWSNVNVRSLFVSRSRDQVCPHSSAPPQHRPLCEEKLALFRTSPTPGGLSQILTGMTRLAPPPPPWSNMLRCFYLYLQVSGTVHSPHGFCSKHYCIFFLLYHSIGSSNIYIRSQGSVNILKCSAFLLMIMCAAGSARAGASRHPLSVKALT